jgi:endonuclease/exonuclease/phosphatase family metal-dependent hydrolase
MSYQSELGRCIKSWLLGGFLAVAPVLNAQMPVITQTNVVIRVMASNLNGDSQKYGPPQLRILQGLRPDIAAMQEFNYSNNTPAQLRAFVDTAFGTNFVYFRETSGTETYSIPNGIVSRFPFVNVGNWDDTSIPDRGFAWAQIDIPGTNNLYVVSVHLKASSGSESTRATEAANLKALIQANFPANALVIVAGDLNTQSRSTSSEPCLTTFYTFLSDNPVPTDAESGGDPDTNLNRNKPYDYVLPGFSLTNALTNAVFASHSFANGLVFDSRVYTPLSDVAPVQFNDATNCQHMGVVKDFSIPASVTNFVTVPQPLLVMQIPGVIRWLGVSNLAYTVQARTNLTDTDWFSLGSVSSATTNYSFTNFSPGVAQQYYRVTYP